MISSALRSPVKTETTAKSANTIPVPSGITELILAEGCPHAFGMIMPMLAFLSHSEPDRWVTWVAPSFLSKEVLETYGINTRCLRMVHVSDVANSLWVTWEALSAGNSHTVVASPGRMTEKELKLLEQAAQQGRCQGILLRSR